MAGELARWFSSTPAERERDRKVEKVHNNTDVARARVEAIVQVAQFAELGVLSVCMIKREASMLVPEDAAKFDLVATQATIAMANEVSRAAGR